MGSWFGNLDLAYKYTVVFVSLLALTLIAGFIKVLIDRRKLRKVLAKRDIENSPNEDQAQLNHREKDEGDLFGIRAIEAGYFAGIPQSRPTSRAGSIAGGSAMMSSSTLVGAGYNTPKLKSMASSVASLPLAHTYERRDSDTLPSMSRRPSPPAIRLGPSEAELNGRINHSASASVILEIPPSVHTPSQRYSDSDSDDSDMQTLRSGRYSPVAPQVPMENHLQVAVTPADGSHKSHAASVNDTSPLSTPNCSAPPSPGPHRPLSYVPSMPDHLNRGESSDQRPASYRPEPPTLQESPEQAEEPVMLLPRTYDPTHRRQSSDASSIYSQRQTSSAKSTKSTKSGHSRNFSLPSIANRNSIVAPSMHSEESWLPPLPSSTLLPSQPFPSTDATNDPRFSAFYEAYFRNSRLNEGLQFDAHVQGLGISQPSAEEEEKITEDPPKSPKPGVAL